jgi:hypothetical protein
VSLDPTLASILADVVVFIHLCYMGYVVLGQLVIMIGWPLRWQWIRNPWFRLSHLAMILVVAGEAVVDYPCPLTTWEHELRVAAGQKSVGEVQVEGASFTGQLLRNIQFAGQLYWEDYINTTFYIAAAVIVVTAILVPPRFCKKPAPIEVPEARS